MNITKLLLFVAALVLSASALAASPVSYHRIRGHLIEWEGYHTSPYRDGSDWSVGVGHNLTANGQKVRKSYSRTEIEQFLIADISWALDVCRAGVRDFDDLPESAQLVAIGVAFTVGRTGFMRLHGFRTALSYRSFNAAGHELNSLKWAKQVSPNRRKQYVMTLVNLN